MYKKEQLLNGKVNCTWTVVDYWMGEQGRGLGPGSLGVRKYGAKDIIILKKISFKNRF